MVVQTSIEWLFIGTRFIGQILSFYVKKCIKIYIYIYQFETFDFIVELAQTLINLHFKKNRLTELSFLINI